MPYDCIIIGTGPAGLMAASKLQTPNRKILIVDRRKAPGWKILVAGSSGLNVTYECAEGDLPNFYREGRTRLQFALEKFGKNAWLDFLSELGLETFLGTSRRYFLKSMKASPLVRAWIQRLREGGTEFLFGEELREFESKDDRVNVTFASGLELQTKTLLLALGGPSWETTPSSWPEIFHQKGIALSPFQPANAGYSFKASQDFFHRAEGKPIKGLTLRTARGVKQGELMITNYGLEGTPIYAIGCPGLAELDLKPDLTEEKLIERMESWRGNLNAKLERGAKLSEGAILLLKELSQFSTTKEAAHAIKHLPIDLLAPRPLSESISSSGGVKWEELSRDLEIKKAPRIFCAGEMIDWDAPTGGFLFQASVATGSLAAEGIVKLLSNPPSPR